MLGIVPHAVQTRCLVASGAPAAPELPPAPAPELPPDPTRTVHSALDSQPSARNSSKVSVRSPTSEKVTSGDLFESNFFRGARADAPEKSNQVNTCTVPTAPPLSRRTVRRALGAQAWAEPLVLAFAPVFALLAVVTPAGDARMRWLWATLSVAAALVGFFSLVEQRRRVAFVFELCQARRELAMALLVREGVTLRRDTTLRCYPLQASLLFVTLRSATCPSSHERRGARALAIAVNLALGWWSITGLFTTPLILWRCARGGDVTTPAELIGVVDAYVEAAANRPRSVGITVLLLVALAMALLFALALLVVRLTV